MSRKDLKVLIKLFLSWRLLLFALLFLAIPILTLQMNFLGGGLSSYLGAPYLWSWVNFDGEHYLSIAYHGYQPLTYFYFPFYPLVVRFLAYFFSDGFTSYAISGLLVSNVSFILALLGFWKLAREDYKADVAWTSLFLLLLFPTSFYFGGLYTESTFLLFVVWSFYLARKGHWLSAGVLGAMASATRLVGLALLPAMLVEMWIQGKEGKRTNYTQALIAALLIPLGLFAYMYFLKLKTGDPLEFLHSVGIFGQQRSSSLVLLPQVFYRYIFKVLPSLNYNYFPVVFATLLESSTAILFLLLSLLSFFRLRLSFAVYLALAFLIPTFSGSFSSLPRYVLIAFPGFIFLAIYLLKLPNWARTTIYVLLTVCLAIATAFFVRGYWIA